MIRITISEEIARACPDVHILALSCQLTNTPSDPDLWEEITAAEKQFRSQYVLSDINRIPSIQATRQVYKRLGKDPNRYRPSSEALCRRILRELPLYRIDTVVDMVNLLSIQTGYSIGAFDRDKIAGDHLFLGVGEAGELYHGIGRGELNIEGLPVYRDNAGGIGTPTSDEERTKIELSTEKLLMIINGYAGREGLADAGRLAAGLLKQYVSADHMEGELISYSNRIPISL
ncbi:MAG: hypothetical protein LIP06_04715 [Tannerellaceae bacterium]|nr:hypothetical protein [Tannerellaceae bacterium]